MVRRKGETTGAFQIHSRKTAITQRSKSEEKEAGLAQSLYSPQGNERQLHRLGTNGINQPKRKITQGAGIVKGWEDKGGRGCILDTFT